MKPEVVDHHNIRAFRDMLAYSEGTDKPGQPTKNKGYDVIVGGSLFTDYRAHPRRSIYLPKLGINSTAAGRYQFIIRTWEGLVRQYGLKDFSPRSQDIGCTGLLVGCGAANLLMAGKFDEAVHAARKIWASLPGAGYGQREEKLDTLRRIYRSAGGKIA